MGRIAPQLRVLQGLAECILEKQRTIMFQQQDLAVWSRSNWLRTFQVDVQYTATTLALVATASCLPSVEKPALMHIAASSRSWATLMQCSCVTAPPCSETTCTVPSEHGQAAKGSVVLCLQPKRARSRHTLGISPARASVSSKQV